MDKPLLTIAPHSTLGLLPLIVAILIGSRALGFSAATNAPAFRFHPELAEMTNRLTAPIVLTNSPLLGMPLLQASNLFANAGFRWMTNNVASVATGYRRFPRQPDYIWERRFILTIAHDKVAKVEVYDEPTDVVYQKRK